MMALEGWILEWYSLAKPSYGRNRPSTYGQNSDCTIGIVLINTCVQPSAACDNKWREVPQRKFPN